MEDPFLERNRGRQVGHVQRVQEGIVGHGLLWLVAPAHGQEKAAVLRCKRQFLG